MSAGGLELCLARDGGDAQLLAANEKPGRTDWTIDAAKTTVEGNLRRQACIYHWKVEA